MRFGFITTILLIMTSLVVADNEDELLRRFAPVLWLTSGEDNLPSSIDFYFNQAEILNDGKRVQSAKNWQHPTSLDDAKRSWKFKMQPLPGYEEKLANGFPLPSDGGRVSTAVPIYAFSRPSPCDLTKKWLCYIPFYPFNGNIFLKHPSLLTATYFVIGAVAATVASIYTGGLSTIALGILGVGFVSSTTFFIHWTDTEEVIVELNQDNSLSRVYISSHDGGGWHNINDFNFVGDHVEVFVARRSHAIYTTAGIHTRLGAVANDLTEKGIKWDTQVHVVNLKWDLYHKAFTNATEYLHFTNPSNPDAFPFKWMTYAGHMGYEKAKFPYTWNVNIDPQPGIYSPTWSSPYYGDGKEEFCHVEQKKRNIEQDSQSSIVIAGDSADNIYGIIVHPDSTEVKYLDTTQSEFRSSLVSNLGLSEIEKEFHISGALVASCKSKTIHVVVSCKAPHLVLAWQRMYRGPNEPWNVIKREIPAAVLTDLEITWNKETGFCMLLVAEETSPSLFCWKNFEDFMFANITLNNKKGGNTALVSCAGATYLFWSHTSTPGLQSYILQPNTMTWNSPLQISSQILFYSLIGHCNSSNSVVKLYGISFDSVGNFTAVSVVDLQVLPNKELQLITEHNFPHPELNLQTVFVSHDTQIPVRPQISRQYWIQHTLSGLVIQSSLDGHYNTTLKEIQYFDKQLFSFELLSDGFYKITNVQSNEVLDVHSSGTVTNTPIILYPWNTGDNQRWALQYYEGDVFLLTAKHSNKSAAVVNGYLVQVDTTPTFTQMWRLIENL